MSLNRNRPTIVPDEEKCILPKKTSLKNVDVKDAFGKFGISLDEK